MSKFSSDRNHEWLRPPAQPSEIAAERQFLIRHYLIPERGYREPPISPVVARAQAMNMLDEGLRDAGLNWLWWAASGGDNDAKIALVANIELMANSGEIEIQRALQSLAAWASHQSGVKSLERSALRMGKIPGLVLETAALPPPPRATTPPAPLPSLPEFDREEGDLYPEERPQEKDGLVVISQVGDATSNIGAEVSRRLNPILGRKLPFRCDLPNAALFAQEFVQKFPWATGVARYLQGQIAQLQVIGSARLSLRPLLLVGPPGCGKTTIAEWVAKRLNLYSITIPVGGTADSAGLLAVARTWSAAAPSAPLSAFMESGVANPALIIDELDKSAPESGARNGSVSAALLTMIAPPEKGYRDIWAQASVDISQISWIATANALHTLPSALQDRFIVQPVPAPEPDHFAVLLEGVTQNYAKKMRIAPQFLPYLTVEDMAWLKNSFSQGRSIRSLERAFSLLVGERSIEEYEKRCVLN